MKKKHISCCEVLESQITLLEKKHQHGAEACHQAWNRIRELEAENARLIEVLQNFGSHTDRCILSFWEAGEPTHDGGYRRKFKGQWYQSNPVDETPKCDCGFEAALKLTDPS